MQAYDLKRELEKIQDTLEAVALYFEHFNKQNAALHMADKVRQSPLAAAVDIARDNIMSLIAELEGVV